MGGLTAAGDVVLPASGVVGFCSRALLWAAIPGALYVTRFAHREEIAQARSLLRTARARLQHAPS
jgi:hypothetical protein